VARAKFGGVFFFMTVANLPSTMQSVSARPSFPGTLEKNVVVVFSTSDKIPVSRVDKVTQQAATDFVAGINATPLKAASLVNAGLAGGLGQVFGSAPDIDLSKAPPPAPAPVAAKDGAQSLEAEKRAREAEQRAKEAEARARAQTQEAEARARDAEARASEAEEKARARAEEARAAEAASAAHESQPGSVAPQPPAQSDVKSLTTIEELFGNAQKMHIQIELKKRALYKGEIDAIFGVLTREAIREYQKSREEDVTGYLTPQQLVSLLGN
jgi:hypothetical protein